ncbi:unspecified product [Leishmania tarentolae]|uniref:Unspecified product n=1 Tax=Leishmania tarentolae TaxID=5689 RepID=A0A640KUL2_LEITA|nr:unspecified product [Leishmania tarentolae]
MHDYFLFILFSATIFLLCISCCIGCKVGQRQRLQEGPPDGRQNLFAGGTNNTGGATGALGQPSHTTPAYYQEIYYQHQYPHGFGGYSGGAFQPAAANASHATSLPQGDTRPAMSATPLCAVPPGAQISNADCLQRFPEALVTNANGSGNGTSDGAAAVSNGAASHPEAESPYGEADYVPRASAAPLQQMPPPPLYPTAPPRQTPPEQTGSDPSGTDKVGKGKDLS